MRKYDVLKTIYIVFSIILIMSTAITIETILCDGKNEEKVISVFLSFYVVGYNVSGIDRSSFILHNKYITSIFSIYIFYHSIMIFFLPAKIFIIAISILMMILTILFELTIHPLYKLCKSRCAVAPVTYSE